MPTALYTPRVNNNDDIVRLIRLSVKPGDEVHTGEVVAEVETDKASFTVEADAGGYVLEIPHAVDDMVAVGTVLLWLGNAPGESVPRPSGGDGQARHAPASESARRPTLKAAHLLKQLRLNADQIPARGDRLTVADIEAYTALRHGLGARSAGNAPFAEDVAARAAGITRALTAEERGMLRTVRWHRDEAVPAYVELEYDPEPWARVAADYQRDSGALLSPLLALMAHQLARVAGRHERWNSTLLGDERLIYSTVNLGFTVQAEDTLYLTVLENAARLTTADVVARLGQLQRRALGRALSSHELTGATVSFSSMARWHVSRHVPVLPPYTSLIVAHARAASGLATLGATYDHRVLTGFDALSALRALVRPEALA